MSNAEGIHTGDPQWTLGDRLNKARRWADLSRDDIAEYLGLSSQAICNYELDRRPVKLQTLRLWAMRCGVRLEWLRYGDVPPTPGPEAPTVKYGSGLVTSPERHLELLSA